MAQAKKPTPSKPRASAREEVPPYGLHIDAHTRAFNPAGDGGGPRVNWLTDYAYSHSHPSMGIAVIDV